MGMKYTMKRIVMSVCVLALAGCTDLSAVRDISSRLTMASNNWNDVSGDIAGSCQREMAINPMIDNCELETKASKGLVATDNLLGHYFKALMAAATETNFTVQPGLDKVTQSVAAVPGINQGQVEAVSGIVGLLVKLAVEKMREDTLRELIGDGGPAAQKIVDEVLSEIVVPRLRSRMNSERANLDQYFVIALGQQRVQVGSSLEALCSGSSASNFNATGFLLAQEYCRRFAILNKRQKALDAYDASLKLASQALRELQSSKAHLDAKGLAQKLYAIGSELDEKIDAVRKAFG